MDDLILVKHAKGAPGLRLLGLGPKLYPLKGINQLQSLMIQNTFWANNRTREDIRKMLRASPVIVSVWDGKNISRRKAGDVIIRAEQPRLTMIAACSLPYLEQYTTAHDWNGDGLTDRLADRA